MFNPSLSAKEEDDLAPELNVIIYSRFLTSYRNLFLPLSTRLFRTECYFSKVALFFWCAWHLFRLEGFAPGTLPQCWREEQAPRFRVFDLQGRLILSYESVGLAGENTQPLRLEGIASGVYMVDFESGDMRVGTRLVVRER
ncbi:MAG: T9SS type A sorting domain-containing protein [Saprospiraceae bacterium]